MAIKEFEFGTRDYFEGNYTNGNYAGEGVIVTLLECQPSNIFGAIVNVTGGYFADEYMSGDYTVPHLSRFFVQCDIDGTYGGLITTGEYFEDNYIDGTYFHANQIQISVDITASRIADVEFSANGYTDESYFDGAYSEERGIISQVSATATKIHNAEVVVDALFTPNITVQAQIAGDVLIETAIDLTATASKFTGYETLQEFFAALNAQNDRTRLFDTVQTASFGEVVDGARVRYADTTLALSSTVEASAAISADNNIDITAQFTIEVNTQSVQFIDATLVNAVTVTAQPITYQTRSNPYNRPNNIITNTQYNAFSTDEVYGTYSYQVDRNTDNYALLRNSDRDSFTFDDKDFVLETWFKVTDNSGTVTNFLSNSFVEISSRFGFSIDNNATPNLRAYYYNGTNQQTFAAEPISLNTWYHIAFRRVNGYLRFELDGSLVDNASPYFVDGFWINDEVREFIVYLQQKIKTVRLDGTTFRLGDSTVTGLNSAPTNDADSTMFLYRYENNLLDDSGFIADIDEEFTATFSQTASLLANYNPTIELDTTASLVCDSVTFTLFTSTAPSQFDLTAEVGVIKRFEVAVDALFTPTLVADFVKLNEVILDSEFAVAVDVKNIKGILPQTINSEFAVDTVYDFQLGLDANINSEFTLQVTPDFASLLLYAGSSIRSLGGVIHNTYTDTVSNPTEYGWHPVWTNFWFRLKEPMLPNNIMYIYINESGNFGHWIALKTDSNGRYTLNHKETVRYDTSFQLYNGQHVMKSPILTYEIDLGEDFEPLNWHNAYVPLSLGLGSIPTTETRSSTVEHRVGGNAYIDGIQVPLTIDVDTETNGFVYSLGGTPSKYSPADGGYWGWEFNDTDLYLDNIWIRSLSTTLNFYPGYYVDYPPVEEFFKPIATNGTLSNGLQAQVWLRFDGDLLDSSPVTPDWDYFTSDPILIGLEIGFDADLTVTTTVEIDPTFIVDFNIDANAEFNTEIDYLRIKQLSSELDLESIIEAQAYRIQPGNATVEVVASIDVNAVKTTDITDTTSMVTSVEADNTRVRYFEVAQQDYIVDDYFDGAYTGSEGIITFITVEPEKIRPFSATISTEFAQSIDYIRYRDFTPELDSIASFVAATAKIATFFINADVVAVVDATARKQIDDLQSISAEATVEAEAFLLAFGEADITATVTAEILPDKIKNAETAISATFTSTVDAVKTVKGVGSASSEFSTVINPFRVRFNTVTLNTQADVFCDYEVIFDATINVSSEFSGLFALGRIRRITETLEVTGFTVTVGDLIAIDELRQLLVPAETRFIKVAAESRRIIAPSETRILEV